MRVAHGIAVAVSGLSTSESCKPVSRLGGAERTNMGPDCSGKATPEPCHYAAFHNRVGRHVRAAALLRCTHSARRLACKPLWRRHKPLLPALVVSWMRSAPVGRTTWSLRIVAVPAQSLTRLLAIQASRGGQPCSISHPRLPHCVSPNYAAMLGLSKVWERPARSAERNGLKIGQEKRRKATSHRQRGARPRFGFTGSRRRMPGKFRGDQHQPNHLGRSNGRTSPSGYAAICSKQPLRDHEDCLAIFRRRAVARSRPIRCSMR